MSNFRLFLSVFSLVLIGACDRDSATKCELKYRIGGHDAGFYPPKPDSVSTQDHNWMFDAGFLNWQNETGGIASSRFKLLEAHVVDAEGNRLIEDCVQLYATKVRIESEWNTLSEPAGMSVRPASVTFHFFGDEDTYLKSVTYPIPDQPRAPME